MKTTKLFFLLTLFSFRVNASTKVSVFNGNWNHQSVWNPLGIKLSEDAVIVTDNLIIDERTEFHN